MRLATLLKISSAAALAAGAGAYARYRRELAEAVERTEAGGTMVEARLGAIEYAEAGSGEPLLMIHGAGGGYDQGLMVGRGPPTPSIWRFLSKAGATWLPTAAPASGSTPIS